MKAVDLFAGPGGWDLAARELDIDVVGIEVDADAVRTRRAAGHATLHADVREVAPHTVGDVNGLIASPPCQTFSQAGSGSGRQALDEVLVAMTSVADDPHQPYDGGIGMDDRTGLVLEPLRWTLLLQPTWCAWEQVPPVLPVWEKAAEILRERGYATAVGYVRAEQYGVPQTRKRAVLLARRDRTAVELPAPTHTGKNGQPAPVTMAEALGWEVGEPMGGEYESDLFGEPVYVGATGVIPPDRVNDQTGTPFNPMWPTQRPALTIAGRGLVPHPGPNANRFNGLTKSRNDGIRITVAEGSVLQGFPADYPWCGNSSEQWQQIGNAVPPPLAKHLLRAVTE